MLKKQLLTLTNKTEPYVYPQKGMGNHSCAETCKDPQSNTLTLYFNGGTHTEPSYIQLITDCTKICDTSVNFMARWSDYHSKVCEVCADICEVCAKGYEDLDEGEMKKCIEACKKCRVMQKYSDLKLSTKHSIGVLLVDVITKSLLYSLPQLR